MRAMYSIDVHIVYNALDKAVYTRDLGETICFSNILSLPLMALVPGDAHGGAPVSLPSH